MRALLTILLMSLLSFTPLPCVSEELSSPDAGCEAESIQMSGTTMIKRTSSRYRYYGFRVFDATVFTAANADINSDFIGKAPMVLQLCYHRDLSREDFIRSGRETIALNPEFLPTEMEPSLAKIDAAYLPVTSGDYYRISLIPGSGLEIRHNGKSVVQVPDEKFGKLYLGIWLSKYSFSESLASELTTLKG